MICVKLIKNGALLATPESDELMAATVRSMARRRQRKLNQP